MLLLGGPNCYVRGMREAWEENIPLVWKEREYPLPEGVDPKSLIKVPDNAQYFAAIGSVEYGLDEDDDVGFYTGYNDLEQYINFGRLEEKKGTGLVLRNLKKSWIHLLKSIPKNHLPLQHSMKDSWSKDL